MSFRVEADDDADDGDDDAGAHEERAMERCLFAATESKKRLASSRMLMEKDREIAANYNDLMAEATEDFERRPPEVVGAPWYASCTGFLPFCSTNVQEPSSPRRPN